MAPPTLGAWLTEVSSLVEGAGLTLAPGLFTASATPKRMIDRSFVLDVQSRDTGKYANGSDELIRIGHTLTVRICKTLAPAAQFDSQIEALGTVEAVIAKLVRRANLPDCRVQWTATRSTLTPSREHLVYDVIFDVEADWTFSSLP
jgi:hypothetical protein